MNGQERIDERRRRQAGRRGFTLIELLVVMLIILLVSAVVLPTVLPAISHRQVSEAARILQGALVGARDTAINNNAPAGIRLLPDPVLNGQSLNAPGGTAGVSTLDPTRILASNRYIPIQLAPDYSEGLVNVDTGSLPPTRCRLHQFPLSWLPCPIARTDSIPLGTCQMLYVEQSVYNSLQRHKPVQLADLLVLEHPDWRQDPAQQHGDLVHHRRPMDIFNPELFVNVGDPGTTPPLQRTLNALITTRSSSSWSTAWMTTRTATWTTAGMASTTMEMDRRSGHRQQQSSANGLRSRPGRAAALNNVNNIPYTITRRPVVSPGSRETPLPSNVVVDLTTWNPVFTFLGTGFLRLRAVAAAGRSDHGVRGHPAQSQRHGRADHGVLEPVVVRHEFRLLPFLAGRAGRPVRPGGEPGHSLPATPGAERGHSGGRNPFPQGRAAAAHPLHADRRHQYQPGRDV